MKGLKGILGDIKPNNILIDLNKKFKFFKIKCMLSDFGSFNINNNFVKKFNNNCSNASSSQINKSDITIDLEKIILEITELYNPPEISIFLKKNLNCSKEMT